MYLLNVVLERFAGVVGVSLGHSSESTFYNCLPTTRESRANVTKPLAVGSTTPDQLDPDDHAKFGKDAATHHSVQGPFLTVYHITDNPK